MYHVKTHLLHNVAMLFSQTLVMCKCHDFLMQAKVHIGYIFKTPIPHGPCQFGNSRTKPFGIHGGDIGGRQLGCQSF
jgi:hypothetical protein